MIDSDLVVLGDYAGFSGEISADTVKGEHAAFNDTDSYEIHTSKIFEKTGRDYSGVVMKGTFIPDAGRDTHFGTTQHPWVDVHATNISMDNLVASRPESTNEISVYSSLMPADSYGRVNIGSAQNRWSGVYADNITAGNVVSGNIDTLEQSMATLLGSGQGSISQQISSAIAAVVDSAPAAFDTLKEIADWIAQAGQDAANLVNRVVALESKTAYITTPSRNDTSIAGDVHITATSGDQASAGDLIVAGTIEATGNITSYGGGIFHDVTADVGLYGTVLGSSDDTNGATISLLNSLVPNIEGINLGSLGIGTPSDPVYTTWFNNGYIKHVNSLDINTTSMIADTITVRLITPLNSTSTIGTENAMWPEGHFVDLYIDGRDGAIHSNDQDHCIGIDADLYPTSNNSSEIGTVTNYWKNVYTDDVIFDVTEKYSLKDLVDSLGIHKVYLSATNSGSMGTVSLTGAKYCTRAFNYVCNVSVSDLTGTAQQIEDNTILVLNNLTIHVYGHGNSNSYQFTLDSANKTITVTDPVDEDIDIIVLNTATSTVPGM